MIFLYAIKHYLSRRYISYKIRYDTYCFLPIYNMYLQFREKTAYSYHVQ